MTYTYDRLGRRKTVTDAVTGPTGSRTFHYDPATLRLASEAIVADTNGLYSKTITRNYQGSGAGQVPGRDAGFAIGSEYAVTYHYDAKGRFKRITGPGLPTAGVEYSYPANSDRVSQVSFDPSASPPLVQSTRDYDPSCDLLTEVLNEFPSTEWWLGDYLYAYDALGRRESVVMRGDSVSPHLFKWGYNDRSALATAEQCTGTDPEASCDPVSPSAFTYAYDNIGNRTTYTRDGTQIGYTANALNQYTALSNPTENLCYDLDGNLIQDGKPTSNCATPDGAWTYAWDAENRLIRVEPVTRVDDVSRKLEFA